MKNPFAKKRNEATSTKKVEMKFDRLLAICEGDQKMYETMSYFLLLQPEMHIRQLGTIEQLVQKAKDELGKNDPIVARVNLEIAARIAIYNRDEKRVKMLLEQAQSLHDAGEAYHREHFLLSNLGQTMKIAQEYYHQIVSDSKIVQPVPLIQR
jgi:hypothetical protein